MIGNLFGAFIAILLCLVGLVVLTVIAVVVANFLERAYYSRHGMIADSVRPVKVLRISSGVPNKPVYFRAVYEYEAPVIVSPVRGYAPVTAGLGSFQISGYRQRTREAAEKDLHSFVRVCYLRSNPAKSRFVSLRFKLRY